MGNEGGREGEIERARERERKKKGGRGRGIRNGVKMAPLTRG